MADFDSLVPDPGTETVAPAQPSVNNPTTSTPQTIPDFDSLTDDSEKYNTPEELGKTFLEGAGRGATFGLSGALENEDSLRRGELHPYIKGAGELAGLVGSAFLPGVGEAGLLAKAGELGAEKLGLAGAETLAGKIGAGAVKGAIENSLYQATSGEVGKLLSGDPTQSVGTAAADIGLSGLLGGGIGAGIGAISPLWKATIGNKLGQVAADFAGRMKQHLAMPEPVKAIVKELGDYYYPLRDAAAEVYGATGLKAQDLAKAVPDRVSPKMLSQLDDIGTKIDSKLSEMEQNPASYPERLTNKLRNQLVLFNRSLIKPDAKPIDLFNAVQDLKQVLQGYAKFEKRIPVTDEAYDFIKDMGPLSHDLRTALEDPSVWGKAAERQQAINKGFVESKNAIQKFESMMTSEDAQGNRVIDPGKVNTFVNQVGKPNAEIKQSILRDFFDAADKYKGVIEDTHRNLGLDAPFEPSSLAYTKSLLQQPTQGAKLADAFIKRGLVGAGGKAIGAGIGAAAGHSVGMGGFGALIGEHTLGPFFESVLPIIAKPMLNKAVNAEGLKAAAEYGTAVARGEYAVTKAVKNVFSAIPKVAMDMPSDLDREKLDSALQRMKNNPELLIKAQGQTDHYLEGHGTAIAQTTSNAVNHLNGLRPDDSPAAPLDPKQPPNNLKKTAYNRALDIAQNPLLVVDSLRKGTMTPQDLMTLQTIYPGLYQRMNQKLMEQVVNLQTKGQSIPYKTKMGLSLFMGQALDSTMTPQAIMAAQMSRGGGGAPSAQKPMAAPPQPKRSTSSLSKLPSQYQTQSQALEARKSRD